jgi:predicted TIM-barrel fold metal-dependent hydrolase
MAMLRPFCPASQLEAFDELVRAREAAGGLASRPELLGIREGGRTESGPTGLSDAARAEGVAQMERVRANPGSYDAHARLADMDADGVTSEVIFAGAQNGHELPWVGDFDSGIATVDSMLRVTGCRVWNAWLADFCSAAPERLLGVMQIPIWDIPRAVEEIRWGASNGLRAINFAAPRADYPAYNGDVYEPLWEVVEEVGLPLVTHSASGERGSGLHGRGSLMVWLSEVLWLSRRGLGQIIFGGVFDRHPGVRVVFVEQRANWVGTTLDELDSAFRGVPRNTARPLMGGVVEAPERAPSEYWRSNCAIVASFMARFEAELRHEMGVETILWGSDYPHLEGTWPRTRLALRTTFGGVPEADTRQMIGLNGVRLFGLDRAVLDPVARRIGPTPEDLASPPGADEIPAYRGLAFREHGSFD